MRWQAETRDEETKQDTSGLRDLFIGDVNARVSVPGFTGSLTRGRSGYRERLRGEEEDRRGDA